MYVHRRSFLLPFLFTLLVTTAQAASNVVISQVYGGGGNSGASHRNDFIELFNRGSAPVSLDGWSVQYASANGATWKKTNLSGTLAAGQYYLVQQDSGPSGHGTPLPAPDASESIPMDNETGQVALVASTVTLSGICPTAVADFVKYGGSSCTEGAATASLSNTKAAIRRNGGCTDTDENSADFTAATPDPRNSSTIQPCGGVANDPPAIHAPADPISTRMQASPPFEADLFGSDDHGIFVWSHSAGTGIASVSLARGQGTANATYTVQLQADFSGTATFTVSLSDNVNPIVSQLVNVHVTASSPAPHVVISQIYSAGGTSGAAYRNDYAELFNPASATVSLSGWTLQYASAKGESWQTKPLDDTIGPNEYYLVALGSSGSAGAALPMPNAEGFFNLSAASGKLALVRDEARLEGTCPIGDPLLVDLVGYGNDANCSEGGSNAPAGSSTTAIFRKDDGATDTDVNAFDFTAGAASPRRSAPVAEHGPSIRSTDPIASAPRDASITAKFSEPVFVDEGWFSISCTVTGPHQDATRAPAEGGETWIITPNVNFKPGEQCTVAIFAPFVHDTDADDAAPGTDTLSAGKSWTFSVSTGADPHVAATAHLAMGNPSDATPDLQSMDNYLMTKPELALSYHRDRGIANWVSWHLDDVWANGVNRIDAFRPDPQVPPSWYRVLHTDYSGTGFDRGHMTPSADRLTSRPINQATFLMTNMIPQAPGNNQGTWARFEDHLRSLLPANELYVVAGGHGRGGAGDNGFAATIADGHVTVPATTWKVALVLPKADGDDVQRVSATTRTLAVIMPNTNDIDNDWRSYLTTVDAVEQLTSYDFFENVADAAENAIEGGKDGVNPPGVAGQAFATDEDTPRALTLDVASANDDALSYTISGPSHGSLAGSGTARTYTPAPDFNGTDGFTFRVSDGARASSTASVSITVHAVNDPPFAVNDLRETNANETLQFAAAALTANDTPGPADESAQHLTVAGVTATAATHGTVTLGGDTVTYVPEANFTGTASFTYLVCDDAATPLCSAASVEIRVSRAARRRSVRS